MRRLKFDEAAANYKATQEMCVGCESWWNGAQNRRPLK